MILSVSHHCGRLYDPFFFTALLQFISFILMSLKISPKPFTAFVLGIIVQLHYPHWASFLAVRHVASQLSILWYKE